MKLDERAARAAADLLERAEARPIPRIEDLTGQRARSAPRRLVAAAAVLAVLAGGVTVLTGRERTLPEADHPVSSAPLGVTPRTVAPDGAGVTLQLPSTWEHTGDTRGFDDAFVDGERAYVSVARIATMDDLDQEAFVDLRRDLLAANIDAELGDAHRTTIDGHDGALMTYRWRSTSVTEYGIDLDDGTWAIVGIGTSAPELDAEVLEWIASTITVVAAPLWSSSIEHPTAPRPTPEGIAARTWSPDGLGVSVELPATWEASPTNPSGFEHGMHSTSGPPTFVLASRVAHALGTPNDRQEILERQFGARDLHRIDTEVDGHPASIMRYRIPDFDEPRLATLDVEYVIDMGDGTFVWLAVGTRGGSPDDLVEWIRSTIRVDP